MLSLARSDVELCQVAEAQNEAYGQHESPTGGAVSRPP